MKNSGFEYPAGKVVINLAPGGLSKNSAALDLPIALSVLAATEQVHRHHLQTLEFLGELGLFGELRPINGALACALASRQAARHLIVPQANLGEDVHDLADVQRTAMSSGVYSLCQTADNGVATFRQIA